MKMEHPSLKHLHLALPSDGPNIQRKRLEEASISEPFFSILEPPNSSESLNDVLKADMKQNEGKERMASDVINVIMQSVWRSGDGVTNSCNLRRQSSLMVSDKMHVRVCTYFEIEGIGVL
ncbi:hypothetical protein M8J75_009898 [Diaphorina citri]|nr:hypothetical protein M8J75_009898 [Diaphorina citri]